MQEQSKLLTDFYRAYLNFAEKGVNTFSFCLSSGICGNLLKFFIIKTSGNYMDYRKVKEELYQQFEDAGLDQTYPFNLGYDSSYTDEMRVAGAAKNEMRMQWVRDHAKLD